MRELPSGTVTFLFSDIEGSTRLLKELGDGWPDVVRDHNSLLREAFAAAGGAEVDRQGDAFFAVFPRARAGLSAAAQAQLSLEQHAWPGGAAVRVRMGLHTGEPGIADEGYLGLDVVRAARICAVAVGGQVLVSETTAALVRGDALDGLALDDLGEHRLKDFDEPQRLYDLVIPGLPRAPSPRTSEPQSADVPSPLGAWGADAGSLVSEALRTARSLDVSRLEQIGPRIERQVADALARGNVPAGLPAASPPRRPVARAAALAAALVLAVVVAIVLLVRLLL